MIVRRGMGASTPAAPPWYCGLFGPLSLTMPSCVSYEAQAAGAGAQAVGSAAGEVAGQAAGGVISGAGSGFIQGFQDGSASGGTEQLGVSGGFGVGVWLVIAAIVVVLVVERQGRR